MPKRRVKEPTELELEILKCLWQRGPLTGQELRQSLSPTRELTYQSVMTMLGVMEDKGFVSRKKSGGSFVYRASVSEKTTAHRMLSGLVHRVFDGSAAAAMLHLLDSSKLSDEELRELREKVDSRKLDSQEPDSCEEGKS